MKGIILAGGLGTRLYPATLATSKQLLPVYDKPMIYYPLSTLMLNGIREILIITTPEDQYPYERLLADGSQWGMRFYYVSQAHPDGLPQAFILGEDFLNGEPSCLILGDNIFYGHGLTQLLNRATQQIKHHGGAVVFGHHVTDPERYGVAEFNARGECISIEEKPKQPKSSYAITGLYFYDEHVCHYAKQLRPSNRGELEISDLNQIYLNQHQLNIEILGRGYSWLDTGTHESLIEASTFVAEIEHRQGIKIGCPEEIAYQQGWIDAEQLMSYAAKIGKSRYSEYLLSLLSSLEPITQ